MSNCIFCDKKVNFPENWSPQRFEQFTPQFCSQRCYQLMRTSEGKGYLVRALNSKDLLIKDFWRTLRDRYLTESVYRTVLDWTNKGIPFEGNFMRAEHLALKCGAAFCDMTEGSIHLSPEYIFDYRMVLQRDKYLTWDYSFSEEHLQTTISVVLKRIGLPTIDSWKAYVSHMYEETRTMKSSDMTEEQMIIHKLLKRMKRDYEELFKAKRPLMYQERFYHRMCNDLWRKKYSVSARTAHSISELAALNGLEVDYRMFLPEYKASDYLGPKNSKIRNYH